MQSFSYKDNFLNKKTIVVWRLYFVGALLTIGSALVIGRLVQLHIMQTDFLRAQGNARTLHTVDIPSYRGMLTDRRGVPLAISTPVHAVWINPQHFQPTLAQQQQLAELLERPFEEISQKASQYADRVFIYLKRGISPGLADKIKALNITGLGLKREFKRYYPAGQQCAQLIGFTDIDDKGQAGLELSFEKYLKPTIGKKRVLEDRTGRWVQDIDHLQAAQSGQDIALSIDLRIQSLAFKELSKAVKQHQAKSATLVMLDVLTGEVLAMLSFPSFNPHNRQACQGSATRNRALTDQIEPGSTIKTFSIASALASRQFTPDSLIETAPGAYYIGKHLVKDQSNYGKLSLKEILQKSSNVGISKMTLALPPTQLLTTFRRLGLGNGARTPFPGERQGYLPEDIAHPFAHATLAFGYGLTVTPLQLVHAYATLATQGIERPVSLVKVTPPLSTQVALEPDVAKTTLDLLTAVLEGTGKRANIPGYKTAGKTGTTRIVGPQGYDPNRHLSLFVGITPAQKPRLATLIMVEEPHEKHYYGGLVAAPIYKNVLSKALHTLNIAPNP